ncbi:hypothetical protein HAHE_36330 [Haloferula helveola]|uniref:Uncharacterized protein n=1 Tax=Haloferula helveola TaxID=490095 RepID=A0ABM7RHA8_9BACT|nr:hypothetical protein HAHE_36330 [Haloferula helveola]
MKTLSLLALLPLCAAAAPMSDRVSSAELNNRRQSPSPLSQLEQNTGEEIKVVRPAEQSLINQSIILSDGLNWTLVPKGAVLHLPADHSARVGTKPIGNLLPWKDFLTLNHAWITSEEVSIRQAEGVQALDEKRTAHWSKQDKVIVAVHLGGPISVAAPTPSTATASTR